MWRGGGENDGDEGDDSERETTAGGQRTARGWERRVWDSEEGSRRRVIVASARDRPGSSGLGLELRPPLLVTHSLPRPPSSSLASRLPSRSQRRPLPPSDHLPPQNGATPALKLGSPVLTAHDSWDTPPIVRFSRPSLVDVKPDRVSGRPPSPIRSSRLLLCLGRTILGMWPLSRRLIAHHVSHLAVLCGSILRLSRGMSILQQRL